LGYEWLIVNEVAIDDIAVQTNIILWYTEVWFETKTKHCYEYK